MISTTCKDCVFRRMSGNIQVGCEIGILDKFKEANVEISHYSDDESVFYKVNHLCMWRRSDHNYGDIEKDVYVRSNIVIMHNEGDNLDQTLEDVYNLDALRKPRVIVCHTTKNLLDIYRRWSPKFGQDKFSCVQIIDTTYGGSEHDEAFKKSKNGWIFFLKSGDRVGKDMINVLNYSVNHKMSKHIATSGIVCYMAVAYKYFGGHLGNIDSAISGIAGAVVEWDKIYDDYRIYSGQKSSTK